MFPLFAPPLVSTASQAWCSMRMFPFSVARLLLAPQETTRSVPGSRFPVDTCTFPPKVRPPSVDVRKRMSPAVPPVRSAHATSTCPLGPTLTLHPNGDVPCAWMICSFPYVAPPSVEREKRSSLVSALPSEGLLVSTNLVQQT